MNRSLWMNFIRAWKTHTASQMATLAVLIGVFSVISLSVMIHANLQQVLTQWGRSVQMSVYLEEEVSEVSRTKVEQFLEDSKEVSSVAFVSKKEAASRFNEQMGHYAPDLIIDKELGNPLPPSFEVGFENLREQAQFMATLTSLAEELGALSGVDEVSFGQEWVKNYSSLVQAFSITSSVLILVLLGGGLLIVGNSIQNSVAQRRGEIEILELVGSTRSMILKPFLFEGLMMGAAAALISLGVTFGLYQWMEEELYSRLGFWALGAQFSFLSMWKVCLVMVVGAGIGVLGSFICVRKISTGWAAAEGSHG